MPKFEIEIDGVESRRFLLTALKDGRVMAERIFHGEDARLKSREPFAEITVDSFALNDDELDTLAEFTGSEQERLVDGVGEARILRPQVVQRLGGIDGFFDALRDATGDVLLKMNDVSGEWGLSGSPTGGGKGRGQRDNTSTISPEKLAELVGRLRPVTPPEDADMISPQTNESTCIVGFGLQPIEPRGDDDDYDYPDEVFAAVSDCSYSETLAEIKFRGCLDQTSGIFRLYGAEDEEEGFAIAEYGESLLAAMLERAHDLGFKRAIVLWCNHGQIVSAGEVTLPELHRPRLRRAKPPR